MRLGKVYFHASYIVDLDDKDMVDHAKDCIYEDVTNSVKYDEVACWIKVEEAPDADEGDIPEFMREDDEEEEV